MRSTSLEDLPESQRKTLFWACFAALIATSFGFIIRALLIPTWGTQFNLTEVQKGEIFGAGLWPFAISIILFSLVIDRIGYGTAMVFASSQLLCRLAPTARPERSRHPGCPTPIWRLRMVPSPPSSSGPHWIAQLDLPVSARGTWG